MSFLRGLLAARSHLAFLLGLAAAVAVVRFTSRLGRAAATPAPLAAADATALPLRPTGPLAPRERALARAAWDYLERETDPVTGLARSVAGYPSTTLWDLGSQLMGVLAAEDLELATHAEARRRLDRALRSLAALPLCDGRLPNKAYDTRTLAMTDYSNRSAPEGIGWSALDLGRVLVPLSLVIRRFPELTPLVERATSRWDLEALSDGAELRGATRGADGALRHYQEGRLGYEQYAARALLPWGVAVAGALEYRHHLSTAELYGVAVPVDDRRPEDHGGTHAAVLSEPWILTGIEQGFDAVGLALARRVLEVQARRAEATGRLTALSEDAIDRPPGFAYSAVLNGGRAWTAFTPDGAPAPPTFSTKAALGWGVLFAGHYPDRLLDAALALVDPARGILAGRYDEGGAPNRARSLNTNGVVLEALAYRLHGPFSRRPARLARQVAR
ncbi:DUF3131 domain-containing protein [Anaeromyxobacter paludicola]|uniref:DUF3131 domain-containing protein n=1 Tax=Anaeromyxobacter paludicola TaxID=2918171 RepID=A0ABN6NBW8_9BACT|nr:DUF3131 domain-containing protein [Anaeromyxobacter paludicola]BDG10736.1 hypothetical protein AMPC_38490 [Anaeromyxobacter paludicola]